MRSTLCRATQVLLLAGLAVALPPAEARAYINAGFKSQKEYNEYLKKKGLLDWEPRTRPRPPQHFPEVEAAKLAHNGKWDEAIEKYGEAISRDKDSHTLLFAYLGRGDVWWLKRDYARAFADYRAAVALKFEKYEQRDEATLISDPIACARLAAAYAACPNERLRDPKQAIAMARTAQELRAADLPDDVGYTQFLAALYAHAGEFDEAVKWQTRAVEVLDKMARTEAQQAALFALLSRFDSQPIKTPTHHREAAKAGQRRLEQYRQREAVWDFDDALTGPVGPPRGGKAGR